jgi:hypothetical protein
MIIHIKTGEPMSKVRFILFVVLWVALSASIVSSDETELRYREELAKIKLSVPEDGRIRDYLGLQAKAGQFTISQIRPGLLIIEIFNMYCPHCQHYAPTVNQLYQLIQTNPRLKDHIMLIGIGVGNSPFEVDIFRKKYAIAFPLFDDKGYAVYNTLQDVLTPHFMALNLDGKGAYHMFYSKNGGFTDPQAFLNELIKRSGTLPGGVR